MSKYTTEVRFICEQASGLDESKGYSDVDDIIENAIPSIFNFDFPVFDASYKNVICTKILRHYYTREIGFETVGLWKLKLQTKLNEIMPYYNKLYESELLKFNPLYDVDLTTTHAGDKSSELNKEETKTGISEGNRERTETGNVVGSSNIIEGNNSSGSSQSDTNQNSAENNRSVISRTGSENGSSTNDKANNNEIDASENKLHYDLYSDTPQGALDGVEEEAYLTNARKVTDANTRNEKQSGVETGKETHANTNSSNEDGTNDRIGYADSNTKNSYEESADRTSTSTDRRENSSTANDNESRNSFENNTGTDKFNSTESYVLHVIGKQAGVSFSKLLKEFRDTFLNIDMEVIDSLSDLFMLIW